jgi:transposase-like protein
MPASSGRPRVADICRRVGISEGILQRACRQVPGMSLERYLDLRWNPQFRTRAVALVHSP